MHHLRRGIVFLALSLAPVCANAQTAQSGVAEASATVVLPAPPPVALQPPGASPPGHRMMYETLGGVGAGAGGVLLGMLIGYATHVTVVGADACSAPPCDAATEALLAMVAGGAVGWLLGYELSCTGVRQARTPGTTPRPVPASPASPVVPVVTPLRQGALVSVTGRF